MRARTLVEGEEDCMVVAGRGRYEAALGWEACSLLCCRKASAAVVVFGTGFEEGRDSGQKAGGGS